MFNLKKNVLIKVKYKGNWINLIKRFFMVCIVFLYGNNFIIIFWIVNGIS